MVYDCGVKVCKGQMFINKPGRGGPVTGAGFGLSGDNAGDEGAGDS